MSVEVINRQRRFAVDKDRIGALAREVLRQVGREAPDVSIIFVNDKRIRQLNRDYRKKDKPTDVLSFSYESSDSRETGNYLGDVIISTETASRYASELGLSFKQEIEILIIHGLLHLCGYDHETDQGEMQRLERRLRKKLL